MIDWNLIQKESPDAFAEFEKPLIAGATWNDRNLYDYFDSIEIIISIFANHDNGFGCEICGTTLADTMWSDNPFPSRTEAETASFTKAFHIREEQLKG